MCGYWLAEQLFLRLGRGLKDLKKVDENAAKVVLFIHSCTLC